MNSAEITPDKVNCVEVCVDGCVLGDEQCPSKDARQQASKFIEETSLDKMLEMAEAARLRKLTAPPQWVYPEDLE